MVLALCALLAACGNKPFKIGINGGPGGADVARMAASEIRQSGAAKDRRVDIRIAAMRSMVQNAATPAMFHAALDSMSDDKNVGVVVSRFLDMETLQSAQTFKRKQLPFISTTPLPPGIASANGPGFSMVPSFNKQAAFLAEQARPDDKVAIVQIDDYYGTSLTNLLLTALQSRGIRKVDVRKYQQSWDEPRMVALGADVQQASDPTLVYFMGRAPSLELVWQRFREAAKGTRVIGSDLVESPAVYDNPEGRFTGLRYVRYFDPQSPDARMKDLHDRYAMWIGRGEMTGEAVLIYDAMMLTADALRSGARTHAEVAQYFASLGRSRPPFKGVGGLVAFNDDGEVDRKFELAEVTNTGVMNADSLQKQLADTLPKPRP
ncbi:MAG TPA: ABC transporter substrate-binding protein [Longimicrobiales bacterium]